MEYVNNKINRLIEDKISWARQANQKEILLPLTISEAEQLVKLLKEKAGDK